MPPEDEQRPGKPWLHDRLTALGALYQKFGSRGLDGQPLAEVSLLLTSKELAFRDSPKGHVASEEQRSANRALELEIKDLSGYLNSLLAAANIFASRYPRFSGPSQQPDQQKPKQKSRDNIEMER